MDIFKNFRLVPDGDGYILEIVLDKNAPEFADDFLSEKDEKPLDLESKALKLIKDKFSDIKINAIRFMIGAAVIAIVPLYAGTAETHAASATTATSLSQSQRSTSFYVTASKLNVRNGPSTSNPVIHSLYRGIRITVISESGGWFRIRLSDGRTGWVSKTYVTSDYNSSGTVTVSKLYVRSGPSTLHNIIHSLYKGNNGGFDCSGLTYYCFSQVGYTLNRISYQQATQGVYVANANKKAGDLVFFSIDGTGKVDHVGIYIGNGQMIHSPKPGDTVKIANIDVAYWKQRYITTRRIIF
ncbi:MAG: Murein DD-endopeptidase MepH precursor [Firmicutes bacterium ADurb.Bin300]|nr:MAG: Murein DD-endopeptidase MepH precursor [Firmicutes bacterium ADurb.Bin300]